MGPRFVSGNCFTNSIYRWLNFMFVGLLLLLFVVVIVIALRMTSKKYCQLKCIMSKKLKLLCLL
jgi:hypothetical protein